MQSHPTSWVRWSQTVKHLIRHRINPVIGCPRLHSTLIDPNQQSVQLPVSIYLIFFMRDMGYHLLLEISPVQLILRSIYKHRPIHTSDNSSLYGMNDSFHF